MFCYVFLIMDGDYNISNTQISSVNTSDNMIDQSTCLTLGANYSTPATSSFSEK